MMALSGRKGKATPGEAHETIWASAGFSSLSGAKYWTHG